LSIAYNSEEAFDRIYTDAEEISKMLFKILDPTNAPN
jgi:hypothetical protein